MSFSKAFNKSASWRKIFRFPKNVRPNRVKMIQTPSRTDIFHTSKGDSDHGHSVINRGELDYSRTQGGNVVKDKPRKKSGGTCPNCGRPRG